MGGWSRKCSVSMPGLWEKNAMPGWCDPLVSKHLGPAEIPDGKHIDYFGIFLSGYFESEYLH